MDGNNADTEPHNTNTREYVTIFEEAWTTEMLKTKEHQCNCCAATRPNAEAGRDHPQPKILYQSGLGPSAMQRKPQLRRLYQKKPLPRSCKGKFQNTPKSSSYALKKRLQQQPGIDKQVFKDLQKKIQESCLQDYRCWVDENVSEMEKANTDGDIRKIYRLVNTITGKPRKPPCNLTTDQNGNLLQTPEAISATWKNFLSNKCKAAEEEDLRPEMEYIPNTVDPITRN